MKSEKRNNMTLFERLKGSRYFELSGLICLIILYSVIVQSRSGNFLTLGNINNILKEIVVYGILASALTFPLINGTFDLSIESTCALGGTCCALLITDGLFGLKTNLFFAVILSMLICSIVGVANGLLVSRTKIDPFIVTLGTQTAVRGIVYIVCNNSAVTSLPESFKYLSSGKVLGISVSIWILILVFVMMALILGKTSYARVGSATPNAASGYATIAISACAIGGVALTGGKGLTIGVFLGALMMGMITNGMNLMFIGSNWQYVVRGCLMVIAVFYAQWFSKISNKTNK